MMIRRMATVVGLAGSLMMGTQATAQNTLPPDALPAPERPEVIDIGPPILISRRVLALEMRRNVELRDWVRLYGAPEYSEVQEIQIDPPFAPYEVRLYYLRRNAYLAFGRVNVAPEVYDYGVRKYIGTIDPAVLDRLLTAQPVGTATYAPTETQTVPPVAVTIETDPVEGVPVNN